MQYGVSEGLKCHGLRALAIDENDVLWIGSDAGLQRVKFTKAGLETVAWDPIGVVEAIAVGSKSALIGTPNGAYVSYENIALRRFGNPLLGSATIADVHISGAGQHFVVAPELGLAFGKEDSWELIKSATLDKFGTLTCCVPAADNQVIIGGDFGFGVFSSQGILICSILTPKRIFSLCWDNGIILAGIDDKIIAYRIEGETIIPLETLMEGFHANDLMRDSFGNIWISTESNGIARLSGLRHVMSYPDASDIGTVLCIKKCADGILLGGTKGLRLTDGRLTLGGTKVWDVEQDEQGIIWVASERGLLCLVNAAIPNAYHHNCPVLAAPCRVLLRQANGILVGSVRGLVCLSPGGADEILTPDGETIGYVYSLFEDKAGTIWVATLGAGLWKYDGCDLTPVISGSISKSCSIYAFAQSASGDIFIAHDNCISRIAADNQPQLFSKAPDSIAAWALEFSPNDHLLVGSTRGLVEFDIETGQILRRLADPSGVGNWEFTTIRALSVGNDGTITCGIASGLAEVRNGLVSGTENGPKAQLSAVRWSGVTPLEEGLIDTVEEANWRVEFDLRSNWFVDEANCAIRYRLLGFDPDWSEFAPISRIAYNSLPAGVYTLEVQMRSPIVGIGEASRIFTCRVRAFWHTIGQRILDAVPADLGAARLIGRAKRSHLKRKSLQLEQLVRHRMAELHIVNDELRHAKDALISLAHTDPLTGIANRRLFDEIFQSAFDDASKQDGDLPLLMLDIDSFKSYNDSYGHQAGDEALKQVAHAIRSQLSNPTDIVARIGGEEFAVLLPGVNAANAKQVAEQLRQSVEKLQIMHAASGAKNVVTVSIGIASLESHLQSSNMLIEEADGQLYRAKAAGRNHWAQNNSF